MEIECAESLIGIGSDGDDWRGDLFRQTEARAAARIFAFDLAVSCSKGLLPGAKDTFRKGVTTGA